MREQVAGPMGSAPTVSPLRIPYVVATPMWSPKASALLLMSAAIYLGNRRVVDFMHVPGGGLWSGIDLIRLRRPPLASRRAMIEALVLRTSFLAPAPSIMTTTTVWFLALRMGLFQGLRILLPRNLPIYFEMQKQHPDGDKTARWMYVFVRVVAIQGTMQIAIIVVMARFANGL